MILGVFVERISLVLIGLFLAPLFDLPGELFAAYKFIETLPGVFLQLILIPIVLKMVWKINLIQTKIGKKNKHP